MRQHRYTRPAKLPEYYARLQAVSQVATTDTVQIYQQEAVWLAEELIQTILRRKVILKQVRDYFERHPDREIFASLPGAGEFPGACAAGQVWRSSPAVSICQQCSSAGRYLPSHG